MKRMFAAAALIVAVPAFAANVDVGVSVQISQPGVYGRIDIGRFPQPQLVVQQPVIITRVPVAAPPEPVYLWVPPGHRKNWRRHCGQYHACGVPVYFVRDDWYGQHVHPQGGERGRRHEPGRGEGRDGDRGRDRGHGRGNKHD